MDRRFQQLRLDPELSTPLYHQLASRLEEAIEEGAWQAGEALPSERALAEALDVSRITARKALDRLAELGLIRRTRGSGTFITPRLNQPLTRLASFTEMLTQRGFTPRSCWLSRCLAAPSADESLRLGLSGDARVARLKRLRLADGVVMAVEESCLPQSVLDDPLGWGIRCMPSWRRRGDRWHARCSTSRQSMPMPSWRGWPKCRKARPCSR
ncbi:HTH-type transcriptional repressor YvoA [Halomonas elongata]|uniref:HTH-type transcriptional repressor YvoA n=1 Tax=Halomonas elongata TaxID=2746 RepID=A0A1B8P0H4_HALEL|nr:GntR family transcriptional regulator [Halomonas elongata]OBX35703.1 HTH-type transcriptional repressor YvoA [Halomonas elongata]